MSYLPRTLPPREIGHNPKIYGCPWYIERLIRVLPFNPLPFAPSPSSNPPPSHLLPSFKTSILGGCQHFFLLLYLFHLHLPNRHLWLHLFRRRFLFLQHLLRVLHPLHMLMLLMATMCLHQLLCINAVPGSSMENPPMDLPASDGKLLWPCGQGSSRSRSGLLPFLHSMSLSIRMACA